MTTTPVRAEGLGPPVPAPPVATERARLQHTPLSIEACTSLVAHPGAGAIDVFVGVVRDHAEGRAVTSLEYSAYESMAQKEIAKIIAEVEARVPGSRCAVHHRLGVLAVGELAIVCAASTPHRAESFVACRALIEAVKHSVPIWKLERGPDGEAWVGWVDARCGLVGHGHASAAGPGDGSTDVHEPGQGHGHEQGHGHGQRHVDPDHGHGHGHR